MSEEKIRAFERSKENTDSESKVETYLLLQQMASDIS